MIVLMSDFGTTDGYVAAMKGVIASVAPNEPILDATHDIAPQDIAGGAWALATYIPYFPSGTIHVAVVDPGVGTGRDLIVVEAAGQRVLAPDNGLLSIWLGGIETYQAKVIKPGWHRPGQLSSTFHGRDILAYAAALFATNRMESVHLLELARPLTRLPESNVHLTDSSISGQVMHVDRFGNAITGITRSQVAKYGKKRARILLPYGEEVTIKNAYGDVGLGEPLALINSSERLEIAIHGGNASLTYGLIRGARVEVSFAD